MNRRKLVYCLTSLSAASLIAPRLFSFDLNQGSSAEQVGDQRSSGNAGCSSYEPLRVGLVGVVGVGVYFMDRVVRQLDYPCRTIAIETDPARLRWCNPESSLLIGSPGANPATIAEAQRMGRDRRHDIAKSVSCLDVAFLLSGLNGTSGKGVTLAVAESLHKSGIFTIAIVPGRREVDAVRSLEQIVDVAFEIPYPWQVASRTQDRLWKEHVAAAMAQKCRAITLSLSHSRTASINRAET